MSTFEVKVVPINLEPHPNADSLSIVKVYDGYQVVVKTAEWQGVDKGAYIEPESQVPDTAEYAFLGGSKHCRIKARRFRGEWSYGLLMPAPEGSVVGDNVADLLGIKHYEPQMNVKHTSKRQDEEITKPEFKGPYYDIENWRKHKRIFGEDEMVRISEKIHGCNARFTFQDGEFHVASRSFYRKRFWYKDAPKNWWKRVKFWFKHTIMRVPREVWMNDSFYWQALENNKLLKLVVEANPGCVFYGEIYGEVQKGFPYDSFPGDPYKVRLFDVAVKDEHGHARFLNYGEIQGLNYSFEILHLLWAPIDYMGPYNEMIVEDLCSAPSILANGRHMREGVVVTPMVERRDARLGRVILKCVNPEYLEKI